MKVLLVPDVGVTFSMVKVATALLLLIVPHPSPAAEPSAPCDNEAFIGTWKDNGSAGGMMRIEGRGEGLAITMWQRDPANAFDISEVSCSGKKLAFRSTWPPTKFSMLNPLRASHPELLEFDATPQTIAALNQLWQREVDWTWSRVFTAAGKSTVLPWSQLTGCEFIHERQLDNTLRFDAGMTTSTSGGPMKLGSGVVRSGIYQVLGVGTTVTLESGAVLCGVRLSPGGLAITARGFELRPGTRVIRREIVSKP